MLQMVKTDITLVNSGKAAGIKIFMFRKTCGGVLAQGHSTYSVFARHQVKQCRFEIATRSFVFSS